MKDEINVTLKPGLDGKEKNKDHRPDRLHGVLTQVFLDTQDDEITVAIINTYLAKAAEDYDEKND